MGSQAKIRAGAVGLAGAAFLGACATGAPHSASLTAAGGAGGAPAPLAGYDWFLNTEGPAAQLVYGLEDSDDVKLSLGCERKDGRIEVSAHGPDGGPAEIHLESGGETERLRATAEPMEVSDGEWLTAMARTSDPVFQRFRQVGWLAVWQGNERHAYAPHPGSQDRVEQFFGRCG